MGEKRAYKARKPGGGRKKLKPEYDAEKNLKEQMDAAVALYGENCSLQSIGYALALNPIKVRKLLSRQLCFSLLGCSPCNARRSDPAGSPLAGNTPALFSSNTPPASPSIFL